MGGGSALAQAPWEGRARSLGLIGPPALKAGRAEASACRKGQRDGVIRHPRSASPSQRDFEANPKCHIILDVKYFRVYPEGERQS